MKTINRPWVIGVSGASGICYAQGLIKALLSNVPDVALDLVITESAIRVMQEELGLKISGSRISLSAFLGGEFHTLPSQQVTFHSNKNIAANIASGSYLTAGMVILPCSMKTLAAVASGYCENLLQRAADVTLKENRRLIVVPRETSLSVVHLENMLKLAKMDVRIIPAMPGFYHAPASINDLVNSFVMRVLDHMGFDIELSKRWDAPQKDEAIHLNVVKYGNQ